MLKTWDKNVKIFPNYNILVVLTFCVLPVSPPCYEYHARIQEESIWLECFTFCLPRPPPCRAGSPCTKAKIPVRTPCQKNFRSIDFFEFYKSKELISKHQYMRLLGRSISTTKLNWSFGNVVLAIVKVLQSNIPAMAGPDRIARHNQLRNVFYHTLVAAGV